MCSEEGEGQIDAVSACCCTNCAVSICHTLIHIGSLASVLVCVEGPREPALSAGLNPSQWACFSSASPPYLCLACAHEAAVLFSPAYRMTINVVHTIGRRTRIAEMAATPQDAEDMI